MARYSDVKSVGRSKVVEYDPSENWKDRHQRRLETNLNNKDAVKDFCIQNQIFFSIKNNGHHWIFESKKFGRIEWFPSSAKYVMNQKWSRGIHVHDFEQVIHQLKKSV